MNRAELLAFHHALCYFAGNLTYVCDSAYVAKGWRRWKFGAAPPQSHADLWADVFKELGARQGRCTVVRIDSHLSESEAVGLEIPLEYFHANAEADRIAGVQAEGAQLDPILIKEVHSWDQAARLVRDRLAATFLDAVDKDPHREASFEKLPKTDRRGVLKAERMLRALRGTQHRSRVRVGKTWRCKDCGGRPSAGVLLQWLASPCVPLDARGNRAAPVYDGPAVPGQGVMVRRSTLHASHKLRFYDHVKGWACERCGHIAIESCKALAGECPRHLGQAGRDALARLSKGLWPGASAHAREFNRGRLRPTRKGR